MTSLARLDATWRYFPTYLRGEVHDARVVELGMGALIRVQPSLLLVRAHEARDERLQRRDRGEGHTILVREHASHALHQTHEDQRRACVPEGALREGGRARCNGRVIVG